jgi:hypothetical protein
VGSTAGEAAAAALMAGFAAVVMEEGAEMAAVAMAEAVRSEAAVRAAARAEAEAVSL